MPTFVAEITVRAKVAELAEVARIRRAIFGRPSGTSDRPYSLDRVERVAIDKQARPRALAEQRKSIRGCIVKLPQLGIFAGDPSRIARKRAQ